MNRLEYCTSRHLSEFAKSFHYLGVFTKWEAPPNFKIESFVVRVGEWGGHMLVDCDDPSTFHKVCSNFPAFEFQARPVIAIEDAVRVEVEDMAWRDELKR